MQIQLQVLSAVVNHRVLRSGDEKGTTKYSVDLYAHSGDNVPAKFVVSDVSSESEAQAFAAKYPHGSKVIVNLTPRDALWLNASDVHQVTK